MHEVLADKVVKMLLSGNNEFLQILRNQYENSMIKSIENSTAGFFVNYDVSNILIENENYMCDCQIGDVYGSVNDIEFAVGFLLYIKNGTIIMLEGYTNAIDNWPDNDDEIILFRYKR